MDVPHEARRRHFRAGRPARGPGHGGHPVSSTLSRVEGAARAFARTGWRATFDDYFELTKPRIIVLLLITTLAAMIMAERRLPPLELTLWTLLGGAFAAASAGAFNCVYDIDIDAKMRRTQDRPLPRGAIARGP